MLSPQPISNPIRLLAFFFFFLFLLHQSLVNACSQVPISGFFDLEVSQNTLDPPRWSTCGAGPNTHAQISACSESLPCLNGAFIGSDLVHGKSSRETPCPLQVKLISALCLILGLFKRNWETGTACDVILI